MQGELHFDTFALPASARDAGLSQASERWGRLAYGAACAFIVNLYASPAFYWPIFEKLRLGVLTSMVCAFAVLMRRITSGERLRLGGGPAGLLFAYVAVAILSFTWTISTPLTTGAVIDVLKLTVLYVALLNALDTPARIRTFLLLGALATFAPSIGGIQRWLQNDNLIDGYRTAWRGNYADPNRLAMGLVLFVPACLDLFRTVKKPWLKLLLAGAAISNVTAIVLTHSRSGTVALAVAAALSLLRGRRKGRGLLLAGALLIGLIALAPQSFWTRSASIADYEEDVSFAGREHAYEMLRVIYAERPFTGVGAGAFIDAWDRFAPLSAGGTHYIAHNIFLETLGELGLVALILFGLYCAWIGVRLWRVGNDPVIGVEARTLLAGFAGYIVCELVNGYSRSFNLYTAFALAAAIVLQASRRRALQVDPSESLEGAAPRMHLSRGE
jgi:O-antigen ligase